jgi:hypothetical protein
VDDREILLTETWLLGREIGYVTFRAEFFTDAAVMQKWPDPAVRERELRDFWDDDAHAHYPHDREDAAKMTSERLTGYRDQLQDALASRREHARLPSPGEIAGEHRDETDGSETGMSSKGLRALFAEWEEDYAARRAEDAERRLRPPGEMAAGIRGGLDEGHGR